MKQDEEQRIRDTLKTYTVQGGIVGCERNKDGAGVRWHRFIRTEDRLADYLQEAVTANGGTPLSAEQIEAVVAREIKHYGYG